MTATVHVTEQILQVHVQCTFFYLHDVHVGLFPHPYHVEDSQRFDVLTCTCTCTYNAAMEVGFSGFNTPWFHPAHQYLSTADVKDSILVFIIFKTPVEATRQGGIKLSHVRSHAI